MTTRERILTLADDGHEVHVIAAILGLEVGDVAKALAEPGFTPVAASLSPTVVTLGPYTIVAAPGETFGSDLGANILGIIPRYAIVITALNLDGGASVNIDFEVSLDGVIWGAPDAPATVGGKPPGLAVPGTIRGNALVPRFIRFAHEIEGGGLEASATFHVDLTYF